MRQPRKTRIVCSVCKAEDPQLTAWVTTSPFGDLVDAGGDGPLSGAYCPSCEDHEVDVEEVPMSPAERAPILAEWRHRATAAVEAMVVHAMGVLGIPAALHVVANAASPYLTDPDCDEWPPTMREALEQVIAGDRRHRSTNPSYQHDHPGDDVVAPLLVELDAIWTRALEGEHVSPDALERLRVLVERDRTLSLRMSCVGGTWNITVVDDESVVLSRGSSRMVEVAAEIAWRGRQVR